MKSAIFSAAVLAAPALCAPAVAVEDSKQAKALSPYAIESMSGIIPTSMMTGLAGTFVKNLINPGYGLTTGGSISGLFGGLGNTVPENSRVANIISGAKTVKIRYGPYSVPSMMTKNGFGEGGALWNYPDTSIARPCSGKCAIVGMNAGLEYQDGRNANIDSGLWLHHMVLFNIGDGRVDATCQYAYSALPHADVGCTPTGCERMFASGNERTPASPAAMLKGSGGSKPAGYLMNPSDKFAFILDLMNENESDKTVYMTMTYDYVDGHPAGMDHMRPVWLDVDECGISDVAPTRQSGAFTITAKPWTATLDGEILGYGGHVHDGGLKIGVLVNGVPDCESVATYGGTPEFVNKGKNMMAAGSSTTHISSMTICSGSTIRNKMMKRGNSYTLTADYDYSKYKGMLDSDGSQDAIMGIAIMFVRQPASTVSGGGGWFSKRFLSR